MWLAVPLDTCNMLVIYVTVIVFSFGCGVTCFVAVIPSMLIRFAL